MNLHNEVMYSKHLNMLNRCFVSISLIYYQKIFFLLTQPYVENMKSDTEISSMSDLSSLNIVPSFLSKALKKIENQHMQDSCMIIFIQNQ